MNKSKPIKYILQFTLIYKLYNTIRLFYTYVVDKSYVYNILYSNEFLFVLKQYLNVEFKKDWLGRLYGVINPNIDIDGNFNFNNSIIEIDDDRTNNNEYVKSWIFKQLNLVRTVFKLDNSPFFDYIGAEFRHVGPANQDNFLVIFDIVSRKAFTTSLKKFLIQLFVYIIIFGIAFIFLHTIS